MVLKAKCIIDKNSQKRQKIPKDSKSCQSKIFKIIAKSWQKLSKIAISLQNFYKFEKFAIKKEINLFNENLTFFIRTKLFTCKLDFFKKKIMHTKAQTRVSFCSTHHFSF